MNDDKEGKDLSYASDLSRAMNDSEKWGGKATVTKKSSVPRLPLCQIQNDSLELPGQIKSPTSRIPMSGHSNTNSSNDKLKTISTESKHTYDWNQNLIYQLQDDIDFESENLDVQLNDAFSPMPITEEDFNYNSGTKRPLWK